MNRVQKQLILKDLEKKIVLLVGPRQAGKTWLAKNIAAEFKNNTYLNFDQITDRKIITTQSWLPNTEILILDELHKMDNWKNYLKGVFDTKPERMRILVTGSARLDIYNQLGDSLAGRYFRHRLLPLSLAELAQVNQPSDMERLIERSGFPEPYLAENDTEANRWRLQYISSVLSTDVFEIDKIYNIKAMQLVFDMLRTKVGSPVSYQSLAEDLAISPTTVKKYIQILEALFIIFRVTPYSKNIARSLLKEPKIYFFDTGLVQGDQGCRFENLVAVSLLKHAFAMTDYKAEEYALHYLKTKDGAEVDFALVHNDKVESMIEVKHADTSISQALTQWHKKYNYPAIQLVRFIRNEYEGNGVQALSAEKYLSNLFL